MGTLILGLNLSDLPEGTFTSTRAIHDDEWLGFMSEWDVFI